MRWGRLGVVIKGGERQQAYYSSGVAVDEDAMAGSWMGVCAARDWCFSGWRCCAGGFLVGDRRPREKSVLWSASEGWVTVVDGDERKLGMLPRMGRVIAKLKLSER
jgi:hypothetical protein